MRIKLPNGQIANFPDNLSHQEIESILQKQFPPEKSNYGNEYAEPKNANQGIEGILNDVGEIPEKLGTYVGELPEQGNLSFKQLLNNPTRAIKNIGAGIGEGVKGAFNLPHDLGKYLKEKNLKIPFTNINPFGLADYAPHIGNLGVEKAIGLDKQEPGDKFLRELPGLLSLAKFPFSKVPGVQASKNIAKSAKELTQRGKIKKNISELEKEKEAIPTGNSQEYADLKEFLEQQPEYKTSNKNILQRKATEHQRELELLKEKSKKTPENLKATELPAEPFKESENLLKSHEQKSAELESQLSSHLRKGYSQDVPVAEKVVQAIEGIKKPGKKRVGGRKQEIGNIYDKVENNLKDKNVVINRTAQLSNAESEIRKQLESSRAHFKNDEQFEKTVNQLLEKEKSKSNNGPSDIVPASDVLRNSRTVRYLSNELRQKAYSTKYAGNKELQKELLSQADDYEKIGNNLEKILESSNLGKSLKTLKEANKRWREEIIPLYKNETYRKFLTGKGPSDIIYALRGKGPGQEIIREIIKNDPDLIKNVLGQRYANNPSKIHQFDELTDEYIKKSPETQALKNQHFESKEAEKLAKEDLERVKEEHNEKSKHYKVQQEINKLESELPELRKHIDELKKHAKKENLSLKQKINAEKNIDIEKKRLSKIEKNISSLKKWGKRALYLGSGFVAGKSLLSQITGRSNQ